MTYGLEISLRSILVAAKCADEDTFTTRLNSDPVAPCSNFGINK